MLVEKEKRKFLDEFGLTKNFVLFVGRNDPTKQLEKTIQIFEDHLPKEIALAIVSPDNLEGLKMPSKVHSLGRLSNADLKTAYQACLCHINLGKRENFGLTMVEAMMWRTHTIPWADTPAFQDLIIEDFNGLLTADDPEIASRNLAIAQSPTNEKLMIKLNE